MPNNNTRNGRGKCAQETFCALQNQPSQHIPVIDNCQKHFCCCFKEGLLSLPPDTFEKWSISYGSKTEVDPLLKELFSTQEPKQRQARLGIKSNALIHLWDWISRILQRKASKQERELEKHLVDDDDRAGSPSEKPKGEVGKFMIPSQNYFPPWLGQVKVLLYVRERTTKIWTWRLMIILMNHCWHKQTFRGKGNQVIIHKPSNMSVGENESAHFLVDSFFQNKASSFFLWRVEYWLLSGSKFRLRRLIEIKFEVWFVQKIDLNSHKENILLELLRMKVSVFVFRVCVHLLDVQCTSE